MAVAMGRGRSLGCDDLGHAVGRGRGRGVAMAMGRVDDINCCHGHGPSMSSLFLEK